MTTSPHNEPTHPSTATTPPPTLPTLPPELLHLITTHLPPSSLTSLKLTSKPLYNTLPSPPSPTHTKTHPRAQPQSDCELHARRRHLSERPLALSGRRKCILCAGPMPLAAFRGRAAPVCKWHDGWFERVLVARGLPGSYGDGALERERRVRLLCAHCRVVRGWDVKRCQCEEAGEGGGCASCGVWEVECWVRLVGE